MGSREDDVPDPRQRIFDALRALPRGRVASYGQVAARAGLPGRARWVARLLSQAPASLRLPWHRVLRSDGRIAFPPGSRGHDEQVRRLRAEGVKVVDGRVAAANLADAPTLDAALWAPR